MSLGGWCRLNFACYVWPSFKLVKGGVYAFGARGFAFLCYSIVCVSVGWWRRWLCWVFGACGAFGFVVRRRLFGAWLPFVWILALSPACCAIGVVSFFSGRFEGLGSDLLCRVGGGAVVGRFDLLAVASRWGCWSFGLCVCFGRFLVWFGV